MLKCETTAHIISRDFNTKERMLRFNMSRSDECEMLKHISTFSGNVMNQEGSGGYLMECFRLNTLLRKTFIGNFSILV